MAVSAALSAAAASVIYACTYCIVAFDLWLLHGTTMGTTGTSIQFK